MQNLPKPRERFKETLARYSSNKNYSDAIKEWNFVLSYKVEKGKESYCICGQPIIHSSIVFNRLTQQVLIVGNNCLENHIFQTPIEKIYNKEELVNLFNLKVINEWECNFVYSVQKYRYKTEKQKDVLDRVLEKIMKHYFN
jgi:hypothetical protein